MHEFYPQKFNDDESDVYEDFPVYVTSRHWREDLNLDEPRAQSIKKALRSLRPASKAMGLHIINPDPKWINSSKITSFETNYFFEIKLAYRPSGARLSFTKENKEVFALEFKDYNKKEDKNRYEQPDPDLALVLHRIPYGAQSATVEVPREKWQPQESLTYALHIRQKGSNTKIVVDDTDLATMRISDQLTETSISATEGLEVKAMHVPCNVENPLETDIEPELAHGDRIVIFGMFNTKSQHDPKSLFTLGDTVMPFPEGFKHKQRARFTIQMYRTLLVTYHNTTPIFKTRTVDRNHVGGMLKISPAFLVAGVWIERKGKAY